jgi:sugar lactone lactonase YvrE
MGPLVTIEGTNDVQGESPFWCSREQALYWVDTRSKMVRRFDYATQNIASWQLPELTCSLVAREGGGLLVAMETCIVFFDPPSGTVVERIRAPHSPEDGMRFADGRCDRRGRFWVGAKHDATSGPIGILYRFDTDRTFTPTETGLSHPNSLSWSPDDGTMYFADSADLAPCVSIRYRARQDRGAPTIREMCRPSRRSRDRSGGFSLERTVLGLLRCSLCSRRKHRP